MVEKNLPELEVRLVDERNIFPFLDDVAKKSVARL